VSGWTPSDIITGLLALCVGLLTFFGKRYVDKLDALDAAAVRKHDLKELEERMTESRSDMHLQNQSQMREINDNVKDMGSASTISCAIS
jgi:hypothetical protein